MFLPAAVYYEKGILEYELGRELYNRYKSLNIPMHIIDNHNNIIEMRSKSNREFAAIKQNLIIGIRKTHRYQPNQKVSDFLVPFTSSGCTAMCMYCYLVCNYNKCSYLRVFVNREEMLDKLLKTSRNSERELIFEIGSNSDLVLENQITGSMKWIIEKFSKEAKGYITFPTKFHMIDSILDIEHGGRTIVRMSVNPQEIIKKIEFGTSPLDKRIEAINKLAQAGYKIGILIAPVVIIDNWEKMYSEFIEYLKVKLDDKAREKIFFEVIFMTYSFIHRAINAEAFPDAVRLYDKELMTGRGRGKYTYKPHIREQAEKHIREILNRNFPDNKIIYFS